MKEKTFKDLGLDEGDNYLNQLILNYNLGEMGELTDILNEGNLNNGEENK